MREVEIKVKLNDIKKLETKLIEKGVVLGDSIKQHDVVFGEPGAVDNHLNANWLRIRTENDSKVYFTLKRSIEGHLDSIEHEVVVDDSVELENIIKNLGFELYSDLTKIRRKAKIGEIEICVDEVPDLGNFIEAEKIVEYDSNHDEVVLELWRLLESFGLSNIDEVHEGYDVLERRQRGFTK
jgi:adenylate cyclase class 2